MIKNVDQKFNEVKFKFEATEQAISRSAQKRDQLEKQLTRLSLVRQIQNHNVARNTPNWIVNGHNKIEVNSSTN